MLFLTTSPMSLAKSLNSRQAVRSLKSLHRRVKLFKTDFKLPLARRPFRLLNGPLLVPLYLITPLWVELPPPPVC